MSGATHNYFVFFFNDTATTEIYTLSLHDALPIFTGANKILPDGKQVSDYGVDPHGIVIFTPDGRYVVEMTMRSEEHTSELQSHLNLVCRLLLEKKKTISHTPHSPYNIQHTIYSHH